MIVRRKGGRFVLIRQHDHALVSGEFAACMNPETRPPENVVFAVANHDIGWEELDRDILWNEETNAPFSFEEYPLIPKVEAYTRGISRVEAADPYAGFLCSRHYASFFKGAAEPAALRFLRQERERQARLRQQFAPDQERQADEHYELLRFCDDLSLSLCLNEPGENRHPWFAGGIRFHGETYRWVWEGDCRLRLKPNLFSAPFLIKIPYRLADESRRLIGQGEYRFEVLA